MVIDDRSSMDAPAEALIVRHGEDEFVAAFLQIEKYALVSEFDGRGRLDRDVRYRRGPYFGLVVDTGPEGYAAI
ncbi:MAG: hypothetical protein IPM66_14275 [Acidobacteriota bacterium]|nr:MAG: hypothetical protein IPM66_14275 [Acidobacteriota bacterium]